MVDPRELKLEELDSCIDNLTRRFRHGKIEVEDLAQVGRIAAWTAASKISDEAYMIKAAEYAIKDKVHAQFAKKRLPKGGIVSLDAAIDKESQTSLYDKLPGRTLTKSEDGSVIELLKSRFGKRYLNKIQGLDKPKQIVRKIFRSAIEDFARIPMNRIAMEVDYNFFVEQGLDWPLWVFYEGSPAKVKLDLYPNLRSWQFKHVPLGYWEGKRGYKRAIEAVKDFCKDKKITSIQECSGIRAQDFINYGLNGMLQDVFFNSPLLALKTVFPDLERKDKKYVKGRFPDNDAVKKGLLEYFIEHGVGNIEHQTIKELFDGPLRNLQIVDLRKRFSSVVNGRFSGSSYRMLDHYFPEKIKPWLISGPHSGWKKDRLQISAEAVQWLFGSYLNVQEAEIPAYSTLDNLREVRFGGILSMSPFRGNIYKLIDNAYPGKFNPEQFDNHRKVVQLKNQ